MCSFQREKVGLIEVMCSSRRREPHKHRNSSRFIHLALHELRKNRKIGPSPNASDGTSGIANCSMTRHMNAVFWEACEVSTGTCIDRAGVCL